MTPKQKAELFNSYFCSVFRPLKALSITDDSPLLLLLVEQLSDITVSEEEVAHHLAHLDPTKATGPSYKKLCRVRMFGVRITTSTLIPQNVKY
jgi:hypothetical protein